MSDFRFVAPDGSVEQFRHEGDKITMKRTFDVSPVMEHATALRNSGVTDNGHWRHVASLDVRLIDKLCKEAGIPATDPEARKDFLKKKLLDGTLSKFRVHEGTF